MWKIFGFLIYEKAMPEELKDYDPLRGGECSGAEQPHKYPIGYLAAQESDGQRNQDGSAPLKAAEQARDHQRTAFSKEGAEMGLEDQFPGARQIIFNISNFSTRRIHNQKKLSPIP